MNEPVIKYMLSTKALIFDVFPNLLTLDGALLMDDIGCSVPGNLNTFIFIF